MNQSDEMEEKIILAALHVINVEGLEAATVRRIAEEANVNVAAISYYFRGKKKLLDRSFQRSLANAFNFMDFSESVHAEPKDRLIHILNSIVELALKFPGIARAHFAEPLLKNDYSGYSMQRISNFLDEITKDLYPRYAQPPTDREIRIALAQAVSSTIVVAALLPGLPGLLSDLDIKDKDDRMDWIVHIVDGLLP